MALGFNLFSQGSLTQGPKRVGFDVQFKGLKEMTNRLHRQLQRMEQRHLRRACEAFAEPIRAEAQRRARAEIAPYIEIGTNIKISGSTAKVRIGPVVYGKEARGGRKRAFVGPGKDAFWLFFFEYGYWIRKIRKGPPITWVPKRPTMRPAYDSRKEEGLAAMEKILFDAFGEAGAGAEFAG